MTSATEQQARSLRVPHGPMFAGEGDGFVIVTGLANWQWWPNECGGCGRKIETTIPRKRFTSCPACRGELPNMTGGRS